MSETAVETDIEDWAAVKLVPRLTGLQMAIWITENDGYPHDVRVKVSTLPGSLAAADAALVSRWIDLNRDVIGVRIGDMQRLAITRSGADPNGERDRDR